jgi:DNA-binding NarL/FixJ family response regulator
MGRQPLRFCYAGLRVAAESRGVPCGRLHDGRKLVARENDARFPMQLGPVPSGCTTEWNFIDKRRFVIWSDCRGGCDMPILLVVDDSELDRRMIGSLLEEDLDWLVAYAKDGSEALDLMRTAPPDIVVTDLVMPGVDGLELVESVRREFDRIPIIVVTGHGSEDLASQALRKGAASYVPKSRLSEGLLETVRQVLSLAMADRNLDQLMRRSVNSRHKFQLDNDPVLCATFIEFVQQTLHRMAFCDVADRLHVAVALEEALMNAICHGNLEMPPAELPTVRRQLHESGTSQLIVERRSENRYRNRHILVGFDVTPGRAQFVIRDQGTGFDWSMVTAQMGAGLKSKDDKRGLVLIHSFMDEVGFNEEGNEIRMVIKRPAA